MIIQSFRDRERDSWPPNKHTAPCDYEDLGDCFHSLSVTQLTKFVMTDYVEVEKMTDNSHMKKYKIDLTLPQQICTRFSE